MCPRKVTYGSKSETCCACDYDSANWPRFQILRVQSSDADTSVVESGINCKHLTTSMWDLSEQTALN